MKKFLVLAAAILLIGNVQAKEVTVTATGMGDSYDWAVMNAVENAVRQSTEVIVHRNAPMEKFEMKGVSSDDYNESENVKVDDGSVIGGKGNIDYKAEGKARNKMNAVFEEKSIDAHYAGKVDSYKVLSTEEKDGKYIVKIEAIVKKVYGGDGVNFTANAEAQIKQLEEMGFTKCPVCVAKTQYSFSDDMTKLGAHVGFKVTVRNLKISAGAGFIVVLTGDIMTMPGLPKVPAAEKIDVDENGVISGLF